jgi:hypothetical protein
MKAWVEIRRSRLSGNIDHDGLAGDRPGEVGGECTCAFLRGRNVLDRVALRGEFPVDLVKASRMTRRQAAWNDWMASPPW